MNNFHEFTIAACPPEILYVQHEKCRWIWDTWDEVTLAELVKMISEHKCEEKPE